MDKTLDLDDHRAWLARQLLDDTLSDDEAFGIVAFSPVIKPLIAAARPAVVSDEVVEAILLQAHDALEAAREALRGAVEPDDRALYEKVNSALYAIRGRPALALLPGGVPDGYVLVPREPTEEMTEAAVNETIRQYDENRNWDDAKDVVEKLCSASVYRAMLSASPKEGK